MRASGTDSFLMMGPRWSLLQYDTSTTTTRHTARIQHTGAAAAGQLVEHKQDAVLCRMQHGKGRCALH